VTGSGALFGSDDPRASDSGMTPSCRPSRKSASPTHVASTASTSGTMPAVTPPSTPSLKAMTYEQIGMTIRACPQTILAA